jgi:hypothetical protein
MKSLDPTQTVDDFDLTQRVDDFNGAFARLNRRRQSISFKVSATSRVRSSFSIEKETRPTHKDDDFPWSRRIHR